jgi:hypothetical protein
MSKSWTLLLGGLVGAALASPASAGPITFNLNFATTNQSQWTNGAPINEGQSINVPDPYFSQNVRMDSQSLDPYNAVLGFIGDFLGLNLVTGVSIAPTASITTGFNASYHVNSGSLDLNYPERVTLTLPNGVQAGQAFSVGAAFAPSASGDPVLLASQLGSGVIGSGYQSPAIQQLLGSTVGGVLTPKAGFVTTFPYAEANVTFDLQASGSLNAQVCVFLAGCATADTFTLEGIDEHEQILELSTLSGLTVLDQPVIGFGRTDLPGGIFNVTFTSPNLSVDGTLRPDATLQGVESQDFLSLGIDVDQLLPIVGAILHNSIGPFAYDLASIEPTIALGLQQQMTFTPQPMVNLHFSDPVIDSRNPGAPTRDVSFAVGEQVSLFPSVGGLAGALGGPMHVTPTFYLNNSFRNETDLTLSASIDVQALALTAPIDTGFAFSTTVPVFDLELGQVGPSDTFQVDVPGITTAPQSIARSGSIGAVAITGLGGVTNGLGHHQFGLFIDNEFVDDPFGVVFAQPTDAALYPEGIPPTLCEGFLQGIVGCDLSFLADEDIFFGGQDIGRLICITCVDVSGPSLASPFLTDAAGRSLFFSDLHDYPSIPTLQEILDPSNPLYDERLATSQYSRSLVITPAESPAESTVPEPGSLILLGSGLAGAMAASRRQRRLR